MLDEAHDEVGRELGQRRLGHRGRQPLAEQVGRVDPALLGLEEEVEGALAGLGACRHGSADPTEVGPVAGVDLDLRARLEEQRDRHLGAGLQGGGLGPPGGAVALEARLGVGDLEDDRRRELDEQDVAVVAPTIASWFSSMYFAASPTCSGRTEIWS